MLFVYVYVFKRFRPFGTLFGMVLRLPPVAPEPEMCHDMGPTKIAGGFVRMARGPKRRTMVFVDYSALRDTLRKNAWLANGAGPHAEIDFEKLGRRLVGDEGEFIRLNLYTGTPVEVEDRDDGQYMNGIPVHDHEAYRARLISRTFQDLVKQVDTRSAFTDLNCGRMVLRRVQLRHGPAFEWVQQVFAGIEDEDERQGMKEYFDHAVELNSDAKAAREELSRRIVDLKDQGKIPASMMSNYTWKLSELKDEQLDFSEKGVDTKLTVQMLEHCMNDSFDDAILFAADEDYVPLVEAVKRTGRRVIHAFWDVQNVGWQLQRVCDDSVLLGKEDVARMVIPAR